MQGHGPHLTGAKYFKLDGEGDSDYDDDEGMSELAATEEYCDETGATGADVVEVEATPNLGTLLAITDGAPPTGRGRGAQSADGANRRSRSRGSRQRG